MLTPSVVNRTAHALNADIGLAVTSNCVKAKLNAPRMILTDPQTLRVCGLVAVLVPGSVCTPKGYCITANHALSRIYLIFLSARSADGQRVLRLGPLPQRERLTWLEGKTSPFAQSPTLNTTSLAASVGTQAAGYRPSLAGSWSLPSIQGVPGPPSPIRPLYAKTVPAYGAR